MKENYVINFKEGQLCQIGIVVRDLDESVKRFYNDFKIGPWYFWNFETPALTDMVYYGKEIKKYGIKLALANAGKVQLELVQPLYGKGLHTDFLKKRGPGLHHVKLYYKDIEKALKDFEKKGIHPIQSGRYGNDIFVYLDTEDIYGILIEIGNNATIGKYLKKYPE